ncbi:MAG: YicC family protein [Gammaproteobacteria bacterium]|nr:YicC family protein [Gammaproteobacteria bacterium]
MTASMTAFSRIESPYSGVQLTWEVRSVNHRYLDVHLKLPDELRLLETDCRTLISKALNRGRVDAQLKLEKSAHDTNQNAINQNMVENLGELLSQIRTTIPDTQPANAIDILRWPGVIVEPTRDNDALHQQSLTFLEEAIRVLVENRKREGERMAELISQRIETCCTLVSDLMGDIGNITAIQKQKWQSRIDELCQEQDSSRLHQEIAILLTKSDIHEELDRLQTHFDEVQRTIASNKPAGRRLDFLMQELNREANTLGSKSVDQRITNTSVELKVLIDQMREQIQNIE